MYECIAAQQDEKVKHIYISFVRFKFDFRFCINYNILNKSNANN